MPYSNRQIKILKHLYPKKKIDENTFKTKFNIDFSDPAVTELIKDKLLHKDGTLLNQPKLELTEHGRAFIQERKREIWLKSIWLPIIVSLVTAVVTAVVTTVLTNCLLPLLSQTLK